MREELAMLAYFPLLLFVLGVVLLFLGMGRVMWRVISNAHSLSSAAADYALYDATIKNRDFSVYDEQTLRALRDFARMKQVPDNAPTGARPFCIAGVSLLICSALLRFI